MNTPVREATAAEVEAAIVAMTNAFTAARGMSSHQRREACRFVYEAVAARAEPFARLIAEEAKKPIRTARGEVARAVTTFRLAMEESTRLVGEVLPVDINPAGEGYQATVERFPVGPCAFITPFNFPLNLVAHKVAPALAVGCPFVVKPSERTPRTALALGEILSDAEKRGLLPGGFAHVLPCDRAVARRLVTDDRVALLSFTGSPEVGWRMKAEAGRKAVILELGGNAAVVVEPETDLADALPRIVSGAFAYAGQSCISVQRIFLHEAIAAAATERLVELTGRLVVGDPLDEATDVGPLIDTAAGDRIEAWVNAALHAGAKLLIGHTRTGEFYSPTLLADVPPDAEIAANEAFGPVAVVETYTDFADVLARVNASRFGLQAGVFTGDLHKARLAFTTLDVGGVVINDVPTTRVDNMPYGGTKDSGLGREGVRYAMEHMTERRVMLVRGG